MEQTYITSIHINKVRHLTDINIPLADTRKHLILTGKNGSGKTSFLEALAKNMEFLTSNNYMSRQECEYIINLYEEKKSKRGQTEEDRLDNLEEQKQINFYKEKKENWTDGAVSEFTSIASLREKYISGDFIIAYFGDNREFLVNKYTNIENVNLKSVYGIKDTPSRDFAKYLVNLKAKQSFAQTENKLEQMNDIKAWFKRFEEILCEIYDEPQASLSFDIDTFQFSIMLNGREPFDFNTMSKGYSAVFNIICDLILRMESKGNRDIEGVVLIDEIETHLHVELQKKIMPILTRMFPNIQFIVTTHSPFILNSIENVIIYDMEKHTLIPNGMTNLPYSGIVEGYFDTDETSKILEEKLDRYRQLSVKVMKSDAEKLEMKKLEIYLDEIPDYLALDIATEYQRLKLEAKR